MKINNVQGSNAPQATEARQAGNDRKVPADGADASRVPREDSVTLTDTARRLTELGKQASQQPVVDGQRVEQVREALAEGRYQVDSARLAGKLFSYEVQ